MLGSSRFFYKQFDSFPKILIPKHGVRHCSNTEQTEGNIVIPPRIDRGPTDILKALSSTVGLDPTAFHYKYPDDSKFYAYSENVAKVLPISLEAGRKAAKWIFDNNPGFFKKQLSDPPIEDFFVNPVVTAEKEPCEEILLSAIEERNVLKAIEIYRALEKANHDVSEFTKQSLLELTCFYNSRERPNKDVEEKYFVEESVEEKKNNMWKQNGFAQELFETMDPSCSLANSAIIQGMLRCNELDSAIEIFERAKVKNIKLSVGAYNMFFSKISDMSQQRNKIPLIMKTLHEMSKNNIRPNVATLNALLKSLLNTHGVVEKVNFTLEIMAEFERLEIEPSLGSYGYLFSIISNSPAHRRKYYPLLREILAHIEYKKFEILHQSDLEFFSNASKTFCSNYGHPDLAKLLLDMYFRNNNAKFIVTYSHEFEFFKRVCFTIIEKAPIKSVMDAYRSYFYTKFIPRKKILTALLLALKKNHAPEYLGEIWEDIQLTPFKSSWYALSEILKLQDTFSDESSLKTFYSVALAYKAYLESTKDFFEDKQAHSKILIAFARCGDEENVWKALKDFKNLQFAELSKEASKILFNYALSKQNTSLLLEILEIACDSELPEFTSMANEALPLLEGNPKAFLTELINKNKEKKGNSKEKKQKLEEGNHFRVNLNDR